MSKKEESAASVDDLIGEAEKPAKKAAKKAAAEKAEKPAKKPAKKASAKKERAEAATGPVRDALAKVKKSISYADFAEKHGFDIRVVRRTSRAMRDNGEITLEKDGQQVFIGPAV